MNPFSSGLSCPKSWLVWATLHLHVTCLSSWFTTWLWFYMCSVYCWNQSKKSSLRSLRWQYAWLEHTIITAVKLPRKIWDTVPLSLWNKASKKQYEVSIIWVIVMGKKVLSLHKMAWVFFHWISFKTMPLWVLKYSFQENMKYLFTSLFLFNQSLFVHLHFMIFIYAISPPSFWRGSDFVYTYSCIFNFCTLQALYGIWVFQIMSLRYHILLQAVILWENYTHKKNIPYLQNCSLFAWNWIYITPLPIY